MEINAEAWVAGYAAIVATGALFLEMRRWFEAGPKIVVKALPNMTLLDGGAKTEGLLFVEVVNRGDTGTTITHFGIVEYANAWKRFRDKQKKSFLVVRPQAQGSPPILPSLLQPGERWTGFARPQANDIGDIQTGTYWVAIYTTDRERPHMAHIPKPKEVPLANAKQV